MEKGIITVIGKDTVGIIAKVCTYLADHNVNILDISQTIIQGYFNMMMVVDITNPTQPLNTMIRDLDAMGEDIGVKIHFQHTEIFEKMHRL